MRFSLSGCVNTSIFMISHWIATSIFKDVYPASTIYAFTYLLFIPVGHAVTSLFVFGWPSPYLPSLLSNVPIGLSTIAIGSFSTSYLQNIEFDIIMSNIMKYYFYMDNGNDEEDGGSFYSSIMVQVITGIWGYVLSVYVNSPSSKVKGNKKEL